MKKRILCMLTTLVMVVGLCGVLPSVTASAGGGPDYDSYQTTGGSSYEEAEEINEFLACKLTVAANSRSYFKITPEYSMLYINGYSENLESADAELSLYSTSDEGDPYDGISTGYGSGSGFALSSSVGTGLYYIVVLNNEDQDIVFNFSVSNVNDSNPDEDIAIKYDFDNAENINLGDVKDVYIDDETEFKTFSFTPSTSGYYSMHSTGNLDTQLKVCSPSEDYSWSFYDDELGSNGNFKSNTYLNAYETYYFVTELYDKEIGSVNYKVYLTKGANPTNDFGIEFNGLDTLSICNYYGSISSVSIPSKIDGYNVTGISSYAFDNDNNNIKNVVIPNSIKTIGTKAFLNCPNLKTVNIPNTVTDIGEYAFGFKSIYDEATDETKYIKIDGFKIICNPNTAAARYAYAYGISTQLPVTPNPTTKTKTAPKKQTKTDVKKPAKVTKVKLKAKKKKLNVSWKKVSEANGYQVRSATNKKFTKNKKTANTKKNKVTLKKLKSKKKYFVKVRAYKTVNGKKVYGKWSKTVCKKVK